MRISSIARLLGSIPMAGFHLCDAYALTAAAPFGIFTRFTILSAALKRTAEHST